jgi:hypothetical protein
MRTLRRTPVRLLLAAAALGAAVAVALVVFASDDDDGPTPGPLGSDEVVGLGAPQEAGRDFTFGLAVAYNRGDEPAVLERISLVDPTPGLRVIETRVAGPQRRLLYQAGDYRWPSPEITDLHPVRGFEVAPRDQPDGRRGVELVFRLRVDRPGRYTARGVQIDYRVGDTSHRSRLTTAYRVCAVPEREPTEGRRCPAPRPVRPLS